MGDLGSLLCAILELRGCIYRDLGDIDAVWESLEQECSRSELKSAAETVTISRPTGKLAAETIAIRGPCGKMAAEVATLSRPTGNRESCNNQHTYRERKVQQSAELGESNSGSNDNQEYPRGNQQLQL